MTIRIKTQHLIIIAIVLALSFVVWAWVKNVIGDIKENTEIVKESCDKDYKWVNQSLKCHDPAISKAEYLVFKNQLMAKVEVMKKEGKAEEVAVYFRDLEDGPSFGIDDGVNFIPASLVILHAYLA